jgi:uncharacterized protein (TIGR02453 family)
MAFTGFSARGAALLRRVLADNRAPTAGPTRLYEQAVRGPLLALLDELADYGPFHVFRPNRDVRFAKDKTPYKDHVAAYGESQGGAGFYVQYSVTGMVAGSGYYHMAADQLDRFREALDKDKVGGEIATITDLLRRDGLEFSAISALKTAPRGYAKDHPRIELLRMKGLAAARHWKHAKWMHTKTVVDRVRDTWEAVAPMNEWLDAHVGPSAIAPDEDERPVSPL